MNHAMLFRRAVCGVVIVVRANKRARGGARQPQHQHQQTERVDFVPEHWRHITGISRQVKRSAAPGRGKTMFGLANSREGSDAPSPRCWKSSTAPGDRICTTL
jgi:hypothetical protein